jgi:hypothetical protein
MSEQPTPETDAENALFPMGGFTLDFCRKLERERDEARTLARELRDALENHHKFANGYSDKPNSSFSRMRQTTGKLLAKAKEVLP